jgi:hypothetical protein
LPALPRSAATLQRVRAFHLVSAGADSLRDLPAAHIKQTTQSRYRQSLVIGIIDLMIYQFLSALQ